MLPAKTKALLDEVISHLLPEHEKQVGDSLRGLKFKMLAQGLGRSGVFDRAYTQIWCDSFESFSGQLWSEIKRVLEATDFDPYPDCEDDLIQRLNSVLFAIREADLNKIPTEKHFTSHSAKTSFELRSIMAMERVATEARILCAKFRTMKTIKTHTPSITNFYLLGPNSRVNQNSADSSVNIVSENDLFQKLRSAIESLPNQETRKRLLVLVDEGEKLPKKTDIYNNWFTKFLSLTADSMAVVQPFIPALAQLLVQVT